MFNNTDLFQDLTSGKQYSFGMTVDEFTGVKGFALINIKTRECYSRVFPSEHLPEQISKEEFRFITSNTHDDFIRV